MEISYTKELGISYMVMEGVRPEDSYEYRLISRHKIPGLLEMVFEETDGKNACCFNISGLCSLEKYLSKRQLKPEELKNIIRQIGELPENLESYLLNDNRIILSPQTVYLDGSGKGLYFAFLPGYNEDYMASIRDMAIYLLRKIDHQDEVSVNLAYELFELTSGSGFDLRDIKNLVKNDYPEAPVEEDPAWDFKEPAQKVTEEDLWDEKPRPKAPEIVKAFNKEKILKIAGICAPILAVIIVGILLFL